MEEKKKDRKKKKQVEESEEEEEKPKKSKKAKVSTLSESFLGTCQKNSDDEILSSKADENCTERRE